MIIVKGRAVSFDMVDGSEIDAPARNAMLHDPRGRYWKRNSILVAPFKRGGGGEVDGDADSKDYLGRTHLTRVGDVPLPPKELSTWTYEGEVSEIWYTRHGAKYGGKRFRHAFNKSVLGRLVKGTGKARLYSRGSLYRLELPRGAIVDGRGLVWP
jgi:hypothetical protein